jgi:4-hydroxy-4-methyl-2-oxoglutarate aldolase
MEGDMDSIFNELRNVRTPILYDTIERLGVRSRSEGYTDPNIKCILPSLGAMVGYACTGKIAAEIPPGVGENKVAWADVWKYVSNSPRPNVMIVQDIDQPPAKGCVWGDVAASIFLRLGCVGAVTNGGVRDIREVEALGFHLFASSTVVGHAYNRYTEINTPVKIGSLVINPGDLIHGDEHGIVIIPKEIPLGELVGKIKEFLASEKAVIEYCAGPDFSMHGIVNQMDLHEQRASRLWIKSASTK